MSAGMICDNCGTALRVNSRGDDEYGESAAWLKLAAGGMTWDACTRSCLSELLADEVAVTVDAVAAEVAEVARLIREGHEAEAGDES